MERNRYLDLLRVAAIGGVVYGHWLLISVTYSSGQLSGTDALDYVAWGRWVTWAFQVMPAFFLVGGYVNAQSWTARHGEGQCWTVWVRDRAMRLWWPTAVFVVAGILAAAVATATGVGAAELAQAGWLVALQLWFLPVYLLLIALTPALLAAHRRWGLVVPAVMAAAAALVDKGVTGAHWHVLGYANYLLVWGSIHQWGFAWQDRTLTRARWRPYALAAGGAALLAGLLASRRYMADMVGSGNTNPPSIALLAFAAAQCGLVIAAEPAAARPARPGHQGGEAGRRPERVGRRPADVLGVRRDQQAGQTACHQDEAAGCGGRPERHPGDDLAGPRRRERERHHPPVSRAHRREGTDGAGYRVEGPRLQPGGHRRPGNQQHRSRGRGDHTPPWHPPHRRHRR